MYAEVVAQVRQMPFAERIAYIQANLDRFTAPDERAHLAWFFVHALRAVGRHAEAVDAAKMALSWEMSGQFRWRILGLRALLEIGRADDEAAARTIAEMDQLPPYEPWMCEYYGIRARILALRDDPEAFEWFAKAVPAFKAEGLPADAAAIATWAALFGVDRGYPVDQWLNEIPQDSPYRLAIEADAAYQAGHVDRAGALAQEALRHPEADTHVKARSLFVQAQIAGTTNPIRALMLAEQATSMAVASMAGYEPHLVERIKGVIRACEKEVG